MGQARQSKGTLIQVETAPSSGIYQTIPECGSIQGPNLDSGEHEVTTQDTVGLGKEFLGGLIDPGNLTFTINEVIDNALHQQLDADKLTLVTRNYRKVWPTGEYKPFVAYVKSYQPSNPVDGPITASVTLRLTELPGALV